MPEPALLGMEMTRRLREHVLEVESLSKEPSLSRAAQEGLSRIVKTMGLLVEATERYLRSQDPEKWDAAKVELARLEAEGTPKT